MSTLQPPPTTGETSTTATSKSPRQQKPQINLLRGWPNPSLLFPAPALLHSAAMTVLSTPSLSTPALLYGPDAGDLKLRRQLARWNADFYRHGLQPQSSSSSSPSGSAKTRTSTHILDSVRANPDDRANRYAVTGGASQALACLLQVFTDPVATEAVWFVQPAYMLAFRIFEDAGLERGKFRGVRENGEGIDVEELRRGLDVVEKKMVGGEKRRALKPTRPWAKYYRHVIYAVPTFSNPSSKVMSLRRRDELVQIAREYDALIITDDVYDQLQWTIPLDDSLVEKAVMPRLVDIDERLDGGTARSGADGFGNAVSNGSFSKVCGPGLRTGWVEGTEKLVYGFSQAGSNRSGGAASQLVASFLAELLEQGLVQKHITQTLRPAYATRYHRLVSAIKRDLVPLGVRLEQQQQQNPHPDNPNHQEIKQVMVMGGYFLWLSLPKGIRAAEVARLALEDENLIVAQGEMFEVPGGAAAAAERGDTAADSNTSTTSTDANGGSNSSKNDNVKSSNSAQNLRLCLAWEDTDLLDEGIVRLKRVIGRLLVSKRSDLDMSLKNGENAPMSTSSSSSSSTVRRIDENVMETFK